MAQSKEQQTGLPNIQGSSPTVPWKPPLLFYLCFIPSHKPLSFPKAQKVQSLDSSFNRASVFESEDLEFKSWRSPFPHIVSLTSIFTFLIPCLIVNSLQNLCISFFFFFFFSPDSFQGSLLMGPFFYPITCKSYDRLGQSDLSQEWPNPKQLF